jgi:hypothetical protein
MCVHVHECMRSDGLGPDRCQMEDLRWRSSRCHHGRRRRSCPTLQRLVSSTHRHAHTRAWIHTNARASTVPTPAWGYPPRRLQRRLHGGSARTRGLRGGSGLPLARLAPCVQSAAGWARLGRSSTSSTTCRRRRRTPPQTASPMYACCSTAQTRCPLGPADRRCASKARGRVRLFVGLFVRSREPGVLCDRSVCLFLSRRRSCGTLWRAWPGTGPARLGRSGR